MPEVFVAHLILPRLPRHDISVHPLHGIFPDHQLKNLLMLLGDTSD